MKNLTAIETAGALDIVLSDKIGTLTQNKMTVTTIYTNQMVFEVELDNLSKRELIDIIDNYRVFVGITPQHKLRIASAFQNKEHVAIMLEIVQMTHQIEESIYWHFNGERRNRRS